MLKFQKYEGAGNDFIMVNNLNKDISLSKEEIIRICDRHFGIGADGVILLEKSEVADCFMNYYNSDGTLAEMCGNGSRCTVDFFIKETDYNKKEINLDTRAGIKKIKVNDDSTYSVDIGVPLFESDNFISSTKEIEGFDFNSVNLGNPHTVTIVKDLNAIDLKNIGSRVENDLNFPNKINVEFVQKINDNYYKVKVWERGCGETLACGTGAGAVFAVLDKFSTGQENLRLEEITLEFPGGKLFLSKNEQDHVILRGPATFVFNGEIIL